MRECYKEFNLVLDGRKYLMEQQNFLEWMSTDIKLGLFGTWWEHFQVFSALKCLRENLKAGDGGFEVLSEWRASEGFRSTKVGGWVYG